jgi:DnaJ-class molecular chaperone
MKSYYSLLELQPGASDDDIKKAYRRLAMKYHPDRTQNNKAAEELFKLIKEAYEHLTDPKYRYVQQQTSYSPKPQNPAPYQHPNVINSKTAVADVTINVTIRHVYTGISARSSKMTICPACSGTGKYAQFSPGSIGETVWRHKGRSSFGTEKDKEANRCGACKGLGEIVDFDCFFDIPAGVSDGIMLKLECKDSSNRSQNKTKNIKIKLEDRMYNSVNKEIVRKGKDVTQKTLLEGGKQVFHSVDGKVLEVRIPPAMEAGVMLKLAGRGLPDIQTGIAGDLFLVLNNI